MKPTCQPTTDPASPEVPSAVVRGMRAAWRAETSASKHWSLDKPSVGHCAVTALIVQDLYGGELLRSVVCGDSHYWNRLPSGAEVDLTRDQFEDFVPENGPIVRERQFVLSFPDTVHRYRLLRAAFDHALRVEQTNVPQPVPAAKATVRPPAIGSPVRR